MENKKDDRITILYSGTDFNELANIFVKALHDALDGQEATLVEEPTIGVLLGIGDVAGFDNPLCYLLDARTHNVVAFPVVAGFVESCVANPMPRVILVRVFDTEENLIYKTRELPLAEMLEKTLNKEGALMTILDEEAFNTFLVGTLDFALGVWEEEANAPEVGA